MSHGCTGIGCRQGRTPSACECEMSCDVAPDAERVIHAPIRTPSEQEQYERMKRWAILRALTAAAFLAALLSLFGAESFGVRK